MCCSRRPKEAHYSEIDRWEFLPVWVHSTWCWQGLRRCPSPPTCIKWKCEGHEVIRPKNRTRRQISIRFFFCFVLARQGRGPMVVIWRVNKVNNKTEIKAKINETNRRCKCQQKAVIEIHGKKDRRLRIEADVQFTYFGAPGHLLGPCQHQVESSHTGENSRRSISE